MAAEAIPRLYSVREVSELSRLAIGTIYNHIAQGRIRPIRRGRPVLFTEAEVRRYLGLDSEAGEG